jgi:hypothetical protein
MNLNVQTSPYDGIVDKTGQDGIGIRVWKDVISGMGVTSKYITGETSSYGPDVMIGPYYRGIREKNGYHSSHVFLHNPVQAITLKQDITYEIIKQFGYSLLLILGFVGLIALFEAIMMFMGYGTGKYIDIIFRDIFVFLNGEFVSYPKNSIDRIRLLFVSILGIITLSTMTAMMVNGLMNIQTGKIENIEDTENNVYIVKKGSIAEEVVKTLGIRYEAENEELDVILDNIVNKKYAPETVGVIATRSDIYRALHEDRKGIRQQFQVSPYVFMNTENIFLIKNDLPPEVTRRINAHIDQIFKSGKSMEEADKYAPGFDHTN